MAGTSGVRGHQGLGPMVSFSGAESAEEVPEEDEPVAFEIQGRNLVIRNTDGRVQMQGVPKGFSPETFRGVLSAVDLYWNSHGVYPTPKQAHPFVPTIPLSTYGRAMATEEFATACERRGILMDRESGLTEQQAFALTVLSDFTDKRVMSKRLGDIGVPMAQFRAWMRQPLFSRLYHERAEQNVADVVPVALNNLVSNIDNGDQRAIEFGLKLSGRYDPAAVEAQNARMIVTTIVELVMEHASEDAQRKILAGIEKKMQMVNVMKAVEGNGGSAT